MAYFQARNPEEKQAREIADKLVLENKRREKNATQLRDAEADLVACVTAVDQLALDGDEVKLDAALEKQGTAEKKATALRGASTTIAATITDLERQATAVADRRQRQATAVEIEKIARDLERAGVAFAEAAAELVAASRRASDLVSDAHPLRVYSEAAAIEVSPAVVMVAEVLRHRAVMTTNGQAAATIPGPEQPPPKLQVVPAPPMQSVFIMKPSRYRGADGRQVALGQYRVHDLPAPIAKRALEVGCAISVSDPRRRNLQGQSGMIDPELSRCTALDDSPLDTAPITSAHVFEPSAYGRQAPKTFIVPIEPTEIVRTGTRNLPEE